MKIKHFSKNKFLLALFLFALIVSSLNINVNAFFFEHFLFGSIFNKNKNSNKSIKYAKTSFLNKTFIGLGAICLFSAITILYFVNKSENKPKNEQLLEQNSNPEDASSNFSKIISAAKRKNMFLGTKKINLKNNGLDIEFNLSQIKVAKQKEGSCGIRALYNANQITNMLKDGNNLDKQLSTLTEENGKENPNFRQFLRDVHGLKKIGYKKKKKIGNNTIFEIEPGEARILEKFDKEKGIPTNIENALLRFAMEKISPEKVQLTSHINEDGRLSLNNNKITIKKIDSLQIGDFITNINLESNHYMAFCVEKSDENKYNVIVMDSLGDSLTNPTCMWLQEECIKETALLRFLE